MSNVSILSLRVCACRRMVKPQEERMIITIAILWLYENKTMINLFLIFSKRNAACLQTLLYVNINFSTTLLGFSVVCLHLLGATELIYLNGYKKISSTKLIMCN